MSEPVEEGGAQPAQPPCVAVVDETTSTAETVASTSDATTTTCSSHFYMKPSPPITECTACKVCTSRSVCSGCNKLVPPVALPPPVIHEAVPRLPNFFGRIRERNLTFCIDTSGSMYRTLGAVKEQLIEFLDSLASHPLPTCFNVIEFSTEVQQWADKMVACTPHTVAVAKDWIRSLEAKTGTNTLDALMTAMGDERCDAVVLVTDGMPDQNPCDILDQIALVCDNRPVHCYYIRNGVDHDECAEEFLRDMAMETYGSFHVINVSQHGAIERVTPVYRAEASAERIVRTTEGTIFPSNMKTCTVGTSLSDPVDYVVEKVGPDYIVESSAGDALIPCYSNMRNQDSRYYYSYYYPYLGWSRYRSNDHWKKSADRIIDMATGGPSHLPPYITPGPGALVIGQQVLVRRHADGYFYQGTIKSEIFERKFLVEFQPCKHGKYKETSYQETFLYDILSLEDALRHSIMLGDKVLAPTEKGSDRYAPGTVIEGHEKRSSDIGSGEDSGLVVALDHDGKSIRLDRNRAIWIPRPLHERITFELSLPAKVRTEIATTEDYPLHSLPGYPRSGILPQPEEYDRYEEVVVQRAGGDLVEKGVYRAPYFVPLYPVHYKNTHAASTVKSEDVAEIIPGTGLTKDQLNDKVLQQLEEHNKLLEGIKQEQASLREKLSGEKLLTLRSNIAENTVNVKKSVTFDDPDTKLEHETKDSGLGSIADILSDLDLSDLELEDYVSKDVACGTDTPTLTKRRRRRRVVRQEPWKYWKNKPAPSLIESNNYGKYRVGPFRDCLLAAPIEPKQGEGDSEPGMPQLRFSVEYGQQGAYRPVPSVTDLTPSVLQRIENDTHQIPAEWTSPMSKYVTWGPTQYAEQASVRDSMGYIPRPPPPKPEVQGPGVDISVSLGKKEDGHVDKKAARRNVRRQRIIEREKTWETRRVEKETNAQQMLEQNRQRVLDQVRRDWQRVKDDQDRVQATREAKRAISAELRSRVENQRADEQAREQSRIEALRARRERLEATKQEYQQAMFKKEVERQATKEQNQMRYWAKVNMERAEREAQQAARDAAKQNAKLQRIHHFRDMEVQGQLNKMRQSQVQEQRNAMMRSSIFT